MSALVLLYHAVTDTPLAPLRRWTVPPSVFQAHAELVRASGRPVLSFEELARTRVAGSEPDNAIVITFDDGYADALTAATILHRLGLAATLFVTTGVIGRRGMLSASDLGRLTVAGWDLGSHGVTHRRLDELAPTLVADELVQSRNSLAGWTGKQPFGYAYPHGKCTSALFDRVAAAGYGAAAAVRNSLSAADDNLFAIARMDITCTVDAAGFQMILDGTCLKVSAFTDGWATRASRAYRRTLLGLRGYAQDDLSAVLAAAHTRSSL